VFFERLHPLRGSAPSLPANPLKDGNRSFNLFPLVAKFLESFVDVHLSASIVAGMRAAGMMMQSWRNQSTVENHEEAETVGMAKQAGTDHNLLAMALVGYEAAKAKINAAIAEIQAKLGHRGSGHPRVATDGAAPAKRTMSAAGRRRIAAAQRKRWAAVRKQAKSAAKPAAPKKRKLRAAGRKAIIEATRKRWAAYRKAGGKKGKVGVKKAAS
jgi:hypothetical protein